MTADSPPDHGQRQWRAAPRLRLWCRTTTALMLREMATTFGRSPGGYLWAIVEPVAAIALLSFAFSLAFRAPPLGESFALFYATGYLPYMLFHDVSQKIAMSTRFSRPLLSFGAVGWAEAVSARLFLNTLTHLVVFCLVFLGTVSLAQEFAGIDWARVLLGLGLAAFLALGVGCLNCFLFLAYPAWERLWGIALRPLFIVSGVLFLMEDAPEDFQNILWFNPLFHITGYLRAAGYTEYRPLYTAPEYVCALALTALFFGALLLRVHHDDLIVK